MRPLIYVMTATTWQNTNLAPLLELQAPERIVMLLAKRGGHFSQSNLNNARHSAQNFVTAWRLAMEERQERTNPQLRFITGDLQQVGHWRREILEALADLETGAPEGSEVLFNYLGGPSQVKIGTWLGLDDLAAQRPDLCVRKVAYGAGGTLHYVEADGAENTRKMKARISPDAWLATRGLCEPAAKHEARLRAEKNARAFHQITRDLAATCLNTPGLRPDWLTSLLPRCANSGNGDRQFDLMELANRQEQLRNIPDTPLQAGIDRVAETLGNLGCRFSGLWAEGANLTVPGNGALAIWLKGGWFEEYVYLLMMDRVGHGNLCLNLELEVCPQEGDAPGMQVFGNAREIDVAVFARTQMHAIECKAHDARSDTALAPWRNQCIAIKDQLVGPGGRVCGFTTRPLAHDAGSRVFADKAGIMLAAGDAEIRAACDKLAEACG